MIQNHSNLSSVQSYGWSVITKRGIPVCKHTTYSGGMHKCKAATSICTIRRVQLHRCLVIALQLLAAFATPCLSSTSDLQPTQEQYGPTLRYDTNAHQPDTHPHWTRALAGSKPRVLIVNDVASHFEVLAGVVSVMRDFQIKPEVLYVGAPEMPVSWGLLQWLGQPQTPEWDSLSNLQLRLSSNNLTLQQTPLQLDTPIATWRPIQAMAMEQARDSLQADVMVCISPELGLATCRKVLQDAQPKTLVMILHRADVLSPNARVLSLYPDKSHLLALAPHVAQLASSRTKQKVDWAMPIAGYEPKDGGCMSLSCLKGFAIQGSLRKFQNKQTQGYTRSYHQLWDMLLQLKQSHASSNQGGSEKPSVTVTVLGKGSKEALAIPEGLAADVGFNSRLPYQDFWDKIHHSLALIPALGHDQYYISRITSTVIASFITATPMITDQRMLDVYSFLTPQHVFLRHDGEDEAAAMYRVASMPEVEVISRRKALLQLRQELNQRAGNLLHTWIQAAM